MGKKPIRRHGTKEFTLDLISRREGPFLLIRGIRIEFLDGPRHLAGHVGPLKRRIQLKAVTKLAQIPRNAACVVSDACDETEPGDEDTRHVDGESSRRNL
jgi:hypothetical protein